MQPKLAALMVNGIVRPVPDGSIVSKYGDRRPDGVVPSGWRLPRALGVRCCGAWQSRVDGFDRQLTRSGQTPVLRTPKPPEERRDVRPP